MSTDQPTEVDLLRSELDSLKGQLAVERRERSRRTRGIATWVLTVLAVLATVLALLSVWVFRTLNNTDLFVDRVGSVIEDPQVAQAVGERAAAELVTALDLQDRIAEVLPDRAKLLAGPVTTATQNYLAQATTKLLASDQFQQAWDVALREGHEATIAILSGKSTEAISTNDGTIVLNITPVVNALVDQGAEFLSGLLNREITAPDITQENVEAAIAALENALGVDLPTTFGTVTLFQSDDLATAQSAYSTIKTAIWLVPLAALILIGLTLAVSLRRLRTLLIIVVGVALAMLFVRLALSPVQDSLVSAVRDDGLRGAVSASFDQVTGSLVSGITWVMVLGLLAGLVLLVTGDSRPAQQGRELLGETPELAARYRGAFLAGGAVVALALLAIIPGRTWGQLLTVALLYAGYALLILLAPRTVATS